MRIGVHLPLIGWDRKAPVIEDLLGTVRAAEHLGFLTICANDHLVFPAPWLDGPTALAAVVAASDRAALMTTVALPVIRGPIATAKTLAAVDLLSHGRLIAGIGPGSSRPDYEAVGLPFEERWSRFDEAVLALRALWGRDPAPFIGHFYKTEGVVLEPGPVRPGGPPIWIGSWGSPAGLRRVARLANGWLASAYNATPVSFDEARRRLAEELVAIGRDPEGFPNALATMFLHVTDDSAVSARIIDDVLSRILRRPREELRERLLVGSPAECSDRLARLAEAGVEQVMVWPVGAPVDQLERFASDVLPQVGAPRPAN